MVDHSRWHRDGGVTVSRGMLDNTLVLDLQRNLGEKALLAFVVSWCNVYPESDRIDIDYYRYIISSKLT